jgi:hypothetical protein
VTADVTPLVRSALARAFVLHWKDGKRPPDLQKAVRAAFPLVPLDQFNAAADEAWHALQQSGRDE